MRVASSEDGGTPGATRPASPRPAAFERLYRLHKDRIYRYCLSQVGNASDAQDIASDVFVAALRTPEPPRPAPDDALAWLLHLARNRVVDHHRRRARRSAVLARFFRRRSESDPGADVEASILRRDELTAILDAFERLRPRDREIVGCGSRPGCRTGGSPPCSGSASTPPRSRPGVRSNGYGGSRRSPPGRRQPDRRGQRRR